MLHNMAATSGLGCARCGFMISVEDIAQGLPEGADGKPDVEWVVAALQLLKKHALREGKAFVCQDCAHESGSAVTDETLILDLCSSGLF